MEETAQLVPPRNPLAKESPVTETSAVFKNAIVIEERTDIRTITKDALKELGINSLAFDRVKDGLTYLKTEEKPPDWILSCVQTADNSNVLQVLRQVLQDKRFHKTRVSLLVFREEFSFLPLAFELGLLSYHTKPFTKGELLQELKELLGEISADYLQHSFIAANYLRKYLSELEDPKPLLKLEESLVNFFPDKPELFVKLSEALYLAGETEKAKAILANTDYQKHGIPVIIPELEEAVSAEGGKETRSSFSTAYGVESVMCVDPDEAIHRQVTN
ncbi:MAG: hypothetical protein HYW48_11090 [Deltaproteobacteria bacterium]|nr:hypothetical protein [Deltaproteobacteria bacterium]